MVECPLAFLMKEAQLLTAAALGIYCLAHLLVLARPVAAGLDPIPSVKVSQFV